MPLATTLPAPIGGNDDYKFNALYTPGLIYEFAGHGSKIETIIQNTIYLCLVLPL